VDLIGGAKRLGKRRAWGGGGSIECFSMLEILLHLCSKHGGVAANLMNRGGTEDKKMGCQQGGVRGC